MVRRESEDAPAAAKSSSPSRALPHGWVECRTTEGKNYYYNTETKQTTWEYPAAAALPSLDAGEKPRVRGGILADDMGMGKTIEVLSLILANRPAQAPERTSETELPSKATLVVCPLSLLSQWTQEIERRTSPKELSVYVYHGGSRNREPAFLAKHDVVVTTYSTLATEVCAPVLSRHSFICLVVLRAVATDPFGQAGQARSQG
jgi:hypothetical protein